MNEALFFLLMFVSISAVLAASRNGLSTLQCTAVALGLATTTIAGKVVPFFGFSASAGTATFIGIFLAIDLIAEVYGKREAIRTVGMTFAANIVFLLIGYLTVQIVGGETTPVGQALETLFSWIPRLIFGGLVAFLVSQFCDVAIFFAIKRITGDKHLWLRVSGSTVISQAVDTILVWTIAFYGVIPNLWQVILVAYLTKLVGAGLEAPFCYLGRSLNPDFVNARSKKID